MIKVTFRTQEGIYWAVCETLNHVRGSGYFMEKIVKDSDSGIPGRWVKAPVDWKLERVESV